MRTRAEIIKMENFKIAVHNILVRSKIDAKKAGIVSYREEKGYIIIKVTSGENNEFRVKNITEAENAVKELELTFPK